MGDLKEVVTGGVLGIIGDERKGKHDRQLLRARLNAEEKLARLELQGQKDIMRESFAKERERWKKAMGAYSGFSKAPTLAGRSQMDTPYTEINSPGTGFNYPDEPQGRVPGG